MDTPIEHVKGVGDNLAPKLRAAGYDTQADLESATPIELLDVAGIGPTLAQRIAAAEQDTNFEGETLWYRFEIERGPWEAWKADIPAGVAIDDYLRQLIRADTDADTIDGDRMSLLQMRSMVMRGHKALADDDPETAREELNNIRSLVRDRLG